jgi:hypothetical protein
MLAHAIYHPFPQKALLTAGSLQHFLFLNSGTPPALEDGNSNNCVAWMSGSLLSFNQ